MPTNFHPRYYWPGIEQSDILATYNSAPVYTTNAETTSANPNDILNAMVEHMMRSPEGENASGYEYRRYGRRAQAVLYADVEPEDL